jgi:hypothetical protein
MLTSEQFRAHLDKVLPRVLRGDDKGLEAWVEHLAAALLERPNARRRGSLTPARYVGALAATLPIYRAMFAEAVARLGAPEAASPRLDPLRCHATQRELASRVGVSPSTAGGDVDHLRREGWIARDGDGVWLLGARRGIAYSLIADSRAEEMTGVPDVVSRAVLSLPTLAKRVAEAQDAGGGLGAARRWRSDRA